MSISTDTARPSRTGTMDKQQFITSLEHAWKTGSRWRGVTRPYTAGDVYRLRGSIGSAYVRAPDRWARRVQPSPGQQILDVARAPQAAQESRSTRQDSGHLDTSY